MNYYKCTRPLIAFRLNHSSHNYNNIGGRLLSPGLSCLFDRPFADGKPCS